MKMRDTSWLHTKMGYWLHILSLAMVVMHVFSEIPHEYHLTCTEGGMSFDYHNSTSTHIINLLKKDAWKSSMMLRYELRNHSTISHCAHHFEGEEYTINFTYAECGAEAVSLTSDNDTIVRMAIVEVQPNGEAVLPFIRSINFTRYCLVCTYNRGYDISSSFNVTGALSTVEKIEVSRKEDFQLKMDLYETAAFDTKATPPMQVTLNEPIYVSLEKMINDTDLKMVVNDCWASDQPLGNPVSAYSFLHQGCGLDPTYQMLEESTNRFRFQINAFVFFQLKQRIYLHCQIFICMNNSTDGECQNGCTSKSRRRREINEDHRRERRAVTTTVGVGKDVKNQMGIAVSMGILYKRKPKCSSIVCPQYSTCVENYPAFCRCKNGFVMHNEKRVCVASNLVEFRLPMRLGWIDQYKNTNSQEFLRLTNMYEKKIWDYCVEKQSIKGIKGLKIESVRQTTSLISFRIVMHLQDNSTAIVNTVSNQLQTLIITKQDELFNEIHVKPGYYYIQLKTYRVTVATQLVKMDSTKFDSTIRMFIVGIGVALLSIIVFAVYKRNKKQTTVKVVDKKPKVAASVNNGFSAEA